MGVSPLKKRIETEEAPPAQSSGPGARKLKKGEMLFSEGESSRAMYLIKSGLIRIYKKKGLSNIEIDTIHSDQVLGELSFLDGEPRSASGEALTDCELVEISGPIFADTLSKMPEWVKVLIKTVVGRLRTASSRIRQLEMASTTLVYGDGDGKRSSQYTYLANHEVLKICSALLLVAAQNGETTSNGVRIRVALLQRYANQIMGVPMAKIMSMLEILTGAEILVVEANKNATEVTISDVDFLEKTIAWMNEQNLLEVKKRSEISVKSFFLMSLIVKHIDQFKTDPEIGMTQVNLAQIKKQEVTASGKEPFQLEDLGDLIKVGYCSELNAKTSESMYVALNRNAFISAYKMQRVMIAVESVNEEKSR